METLRNVHIAIYSDDEVITAPSRTTSLLPSLSKAQTSLALAAKEYRRPSGRMPCVRLKGIAHPFDYFVIAIDEIVLLSP